MPALKLTCLDCGQTNRIPEEKLAAGPKCGTCGARLVDGKVHEVDLRMLEKASKTDDLTLVVDFWAPWCGPCRMMAPQYSEAAGKLAGTARLVKLNTEEHPKAGARYGIRGIPMLAAFKGGRETARQAGAIAAPQIVDWVRRAG